MAVYQYKLVVNAVSLGKHQKGVGRYAENLIKQLEKKLPQTWKIIVIMFSGAEYTIPVSNRLEVAFIPHKSEFFTGLFSIPKLLKYSAANVLLNTAECVSRESSIPQFTICHDINELIWDAQNIPKTFIRKVIDIVLQKFRISAMRKSEIVFCNSDYVKNAVSARYGVNPGKTRLAYCSVSEEFYKSSDQWIKKKKARDQQNSSYVLVFATGDNRENYNLVPFILDELKNLNMEVPIYIGGVKTGEPYMIQLKKTIDEKGYIEDKDYVIKEFFTDEKFSELVKLYSEADFYLELSSHEGFGMQIVEALACGTTCLSSGCGALREVAGGFDIHIKKLEAKEIAKTIQQSYAEVQHLRDNSAQIEYTKKFNWDAVGDTMVAELRNLEK